MADKSNLPWADGPFKLIPTPDAKGLDAPVYSVAREMCLAHDTMIRNLNAIYLQCEQMTSARDQADFLVFCQAAIDIIHAHHKLEERSLFPQIAGYTGVPDIMEKNIEQHHAFETGLTLFEEYVHKATPATYDGAEMKRLLDSFAKTLVTHLGDEIPTLLALQQYDSDKLAAIQKKMNDNLMDEVTDKHKMLPVLLGSIDRGFENGKNTDFPPFPFFVPYLVKYIYARRYAGAWRFSPCTLFGEPRPLKYTKEALAAQKAEL